ncbi:MAG: hypothetical protein ABIG28_00770 [archaeon]
MNRNRGPFIEKLILSFLLANFVFLTIFIFTFQVSYSNYMNIAKDNNKISEQIKKIDKLTEDKNICDDSILIESSTILDEIGSRLSLLETRFGKEDSRVLEQKNLYSEVEFKHFQIIKKLEEQCEQDYLPLLFFYSNQENLEEESERMGFILGKFKRQHNEQVMVYSFDFNLESKLIQNLKEEYNITVAPRVLVDKSRLEYSFEPLTNSTAQNQTPNDSLLLTTTLTGETELIYLRNIEELDKYL